MYKQDYVLYRRELTKRLYLANLKIADLEDEIESLKLKLEQRDENNHPHGTHVQP